MEMLYSRILGALTGVAVGDAMGMPSEMWTRQKIADYFGKIEGFLPGSMENAISGGLEAGEVTDDTVVTILMAQVIIESRGIIDPSKLALSITKWAETNDKNKSVIGPSTKQALDRIASGDSIEEAGKFGVTNGASMRIAPVGIISDYKKTERFMNNVTLACMPTHNTSIAISGASAIAAAVSYGISGGKDLDELIKVAKTASDLGMQIGNSISSPSVSRRIDLGMSLVKEGKSENAVLHRLYDVLGTSIATAESVPAALALVYYAKADPMKVALYAANLGGDTDTIGSMACAICGAIKGIDAFPAQIVEQVTRVNEIPFQELASDLLDVRTELQRPPAAIT